MDYFDPSLAAFLQVVLIDIVLAGDNAVVIGLAAARVPKAKRASVIFWGMAASVVLRIVLAAAASSILDIIGLMFAGGLLLLWVAWKFYRDLTGSDVGTEDNHPAFAARSNGLAVDGIDQDASMRQAIIRIIAADLSMSLDNVLAVAGAAMDHVWVLAAGLLLSIALMGLAASLIAGLLQKHPWISYAGLIIVLYVAVRMIWLGAGEIAHAI